MTLFITLGLLNGLCIALSRIINGQLSLNHGVFHASLINHLLGFLCLSLIALIIFQPFHLLPGEPMLYVGGVIGAFYVAINSFVMVRLGSTQAQVLVVSGQMLFGLIVETYFTELGNPVIQLIGAALVVLGVYLNGRTT